jgi:hypothetical protein
MPKQVSENRPEINFSWQGYGGYLLAALPEYGPEGEQKANHFLKPGNSQPRQGLSFPADISWQRAHTDSCHSACTLSCIDLAGGTKENRRMCSDRIADDRSQNTTLRISDGTAEDGSAQIPGGPLTPNAQANPEFAKWWRRWISRVQRMNVRRVREARRVKIERRDNNSRHLRGIPGDAEFKRYL